MHNFKRIFCYVKKASMISDFEISNNFTHIPKIVIFLKKKQVDK